MWWQFRHHIVEHLCYCNLKTCSLHYILLTVATLQKKNNSDLVRWESPNTLSCLFRESSVEEALIEMYLAGVSVRRVEDITEALWGSRVSPSTISELNKKAYVHIENWRNRPLQGGRYPYVYVDGIYLRRNWGGEYENVAILVAISSSYSGAFVLL